MPLVTFRPTREISDADPLLRGMPRAIVAFHDRGGSLAHGVADVGAAATLAIAADDEESGPGALRYWQADAIADLARTACRERLPITVCCDGGIGRSPACAAAILWATGHRDAAERAVFEDASLSPNRHVFDLVLEAMGGHVTDEDKAAIDDAFERQYALWRKAHADDLEKV